MRLTTEQAEKLFTDPESRPEIYLTEINTLIQWAESKGDNPTATVYYAIVAAFNLGSKRGKAYEKRQRRKRRKRSGSSLSVESEREA